MTNSRRLFIVLPVDAIGRETAAELTARAAQAAADRDWPTTYELLTQADTSRTLGAAELELLANAAFLTARPDVSRGAWERLYALRLEEQDQAGAAAAAVRLGGLLLEQSSLQPAAAWLNRAEKLLEGQPESAIRGYLEGTRGLEALFRGDPAATSAHSRRAREIGERFNDAALVALGRQGEARGALLEGRLDEALATLDELYVSAASGGLDPIAAGYVFCSTVCAAQAIGDYARSEEWTAAMHRWSGDMPVAQFPGRCRVHRAELLRLHGAWSEAESEAERACSELANCGPPDIGWALCELGLVRLRRGDLDGAEKAFRESHQRGRVPHPGMALLHLARGDVRRAAGLISAALEDPPEWPAWEGPLNTRLGRAMLLPAQVEIALAAGEPERAAAAAEELADLSVQYPTAAMRATASEARGRVALAGGDADEARRLLGEAVRLWSEVRAPYETARTRLALAQALQRAGRAESAELEREAARSAFERLGASLEARLAAELFAAPPAARNRRTFIFTDIVRSTDLAELLGDDAWEDLRRWHDELIRALVDEHGGQVATETGDGFFVAFADPERALSAAIAIQRALADHRRSAGFAPKVRIGVHDAEAIQRGSNYSGLGVHAAARLAALAEGDEIVASSSTAQAAGRGFRSARPRRAALKGISEPIDIVSIEWR